MELCFISVFVDNKLLQLLFDFDGVFFYPLQVALGTGISYAGAINENFGVAILGKIPKG